MSWLPNLGYVMAAGSGLAFVALGLAVASVRPRRAPQRWFALYAAGYGTAQFFGNLVTNDDPAAVPLGVLNLLCNLPAAVGLLMLATRFPSSPPARGARIVGAAVVLIGLGWLVAWLSMRHTPLGLVYTPVYLLNFVFAAVLLLLPLRFAAAPPASRAPTQLALMAVAFAAWPAAFAVQNALAGARFAAIASVRVGTTIMATGLLLWLLVGASAVLWLAATRGPSEPQRRQARNVALLTLAFPVVSAAFLVLRPEEWTIGPAFLYGVLRGFSVLVLAYAILRHQLLGLDVKVKWTVKQSTVAAVFVGVFFVVSESVSSFLATEGGLGTYVGIAAAGLLVFAMAPLQRAAERVANAALPGVRPVGALSAPERERIYRDAATRAWSDGFVTRDERALLAQFRDSLSLDHGTAARIEEEVAGGPP